MNTLLKNRKFGFLGMGNMGQAVARALIRSGKVDPQNIGASNRSSGKLNKFANETGITTYNNNEELIDASDVVIVGVKPQDLYQALEPIASSFTEEHTVISLAAGVRLDHLKKILPNVKRLVRVMPNTPANINKGVVGYCIDGDDSGLNAFVDELLSPLGLVVNVPEGDEFEALTVSCSSGIGFVFELMIYWQEWIEEHGIDSKAAKAMTVQTFLGAAMLAEQSQSQSINDLQRRVVSKKGVTAAGLDSMQELEVERALRYSFEKAVIRDRELGSDF